MIWCIDNYTGRGQTLRKGCFFGVGEGDLTHASDPAPTWNCTGSSRREAVWPRSQDRKSQRGMRTPAAAAHSDGFRAGVCLQPQGSLEENAEGGSSSRHSFFNQ